MKYILFGLIFFLVSGQILAQDLTAKQIDQKMTDIRENTDWDNPEKAKQAKEDIQKLSDQLLNLGKKKKDPKEDGAKSPAEQNQDYNVGILKQMMKAVDQGKEADLLFAEPLRAEIVEEFKDDESPIIKSQEYLNEMTVLVLDMSLNTIQRTIDQMDKYKSIQTLVITGGKNGATVDLENLISKAAKYPLQQLYIINFRNFVSKLPKSVSNFKDLTFLALYNNNISQLPSEINLLNSLKKLYVDMNPISALSPSINKLNSLDTLGVAKTMITDDEINRIKQQLPKCQILMK